MPSRRAVTAVAVATIALVAIGGLVALGIGTAMRTLWLPDDRITATAALDGDRPVAVSAPGVVEMRPGPVTVTATAPDGGPVLLARGREEDVTAWVGDAPHVVLTGLSSPTALSSEAVDAAAPAASDAGATPLPDPAASDLWVQRESGTGTATLTWDDPSGRWLLLVAADGTRAAPSSVTLTWPQDVATPWAVPLQTVGAVLLVGAAAGAAALVVRRRRRPSAQPATAEVTA